MKKPHIEELLSEWPLFQIADETGHVVKKLRGESPINLMNAIMAMFKQDPDRTRLLLTDRSSTWVMTEHVASYFLLFEISGKKIFKMAREFSHELAKVDLDVPVGAIPHVQDMVCIEFPDDMMFDLGPSSPLTPGLPEKTENRYARCVYVFMDKNLEDHVKCRHVSRYIQFVIPLYDRNGNLSPQEIQEYGIPIVDESMLFSEAVVQSRKGNTIPFQNDQFIQFVLNCLLYIHSGDPDLRHLRASRPPQTRKAKVLRLWHRNNSSMDMTLVGFNFKKPVAYATEQTTVTGHFRWQPYGPGREKVKLIWIDPFERRYRVVHGQTETTG